MGGQLTQGLGQAWAAIATFVPKLLLFLVILLIGWLIAKAVSKAVGFLLGKIGFEKLLQRSGLDRMLSGSSINAGELLVKLVYYFILLIALNYAFGAFGPSNPISQLLNQIISYLPRVLVAIVLVIIAAAIANVVRDLVTGALGRRSYTKVIGTVVYVLLLAMGIIAALNQLGIAMSVTLPVLITVLATVGGILIVGVGGGLIGPMRGRWEGWLSKMDAEAAEVKKANEQRSTARAAQPQAGGFGGQHPQAQQVPPPAQPGTTTGQLPAQPHPGQAPGQQQFEAEPTRRLDQQGNGGQYPGAPGGYQPPNDGPPVGR